MGLLDPTAGALHYGVAIDGDLTTPMNALMVIRAATGASIVLGLCRPRI
jgi:hypothetical protein